MASGQEIRDGMTRRETRDRQIIVNLEELLHDAARNYAARQGISASKYVRGILIQDLREKGLITDEDIIRMAV